MGLMRTKSFWIGALALAGGLVFLAVDFTGAPPNAIWVWAVKDHRFPKRAGSLEEPYEGPAGQRLEGWIAEATPATAGGQPGVALRKQPGPREKALLTIGVRADTLDRRHEFTATGDNVLTPQGMFWELRRGK
jgi:hypothetical protein